MSVMVKKTTVMTALVLLTGVLISVLLNSYIADALISTVIFALLIYKVNARSSVHMMFLVGFSVFIYFPALTNGYLFDTSFVLFYATAAISFLFLNFAHGMEYRPPLKVTKKHYRYFFISCLSVVAVSFKGEYAPLVLSPFVMFYAMCLEPGKTTRNILLSSLFFFTFCFYFAFGWAGYGRTVTFGILVVGFLYLLYALNFNVSKLAFAAVPTLGSLLLMSRKSIDFSVNLSAAAEDSAVGPYRVAATFFELNAQNGFDFSGFFDQVLFTLFSFVPREIWPTKPFGFGYQYVVDNLDQSLADAGHSIASTLIGDHVYFLGWAGMVTAAIMAYGIARLCRFSYSLKLFDGFGVVILSCAMMVLVWGGMTSFSARIASPLVALSPWILRALFSRLTKRRLPPLYASGSKSKLSKIDGNIEASRPH